jgi:hypothetical protein
VTELDGNSTDMRAHGYLSIAERRTIAIAGLRELVLPAARTLMVVRLDYATMSPPLSR